MLTELAPQEGTELPAVHLYFGARTATGLYRDAWIRAFQEQHPWLRYVPVVSEPEKSPPWSGRTGLVHEAVLADIPDLDGYDVYICGASAMIAAAERDFSAHGLPEDGWHADAFTFQSGKPA